MIDEMFDRLYQSRRSELNAGIAQTISRLWTATLKPFEVLHRIEFDAPWSHQSRPARRA